MKFSLILATLGRDEELARCLASIAAQTHPRIELIIVDQNEDDRVARRLAELPWTCEVRHLRSLPGLSRARNIGLRAVTGDVVGFPDDDCWYAPDLLATVAAALEGDPGRDGVSGRSIDGEGQPSDPFFARENRRLDRYNVWTSAISYTIFLRRAVCEAVGPFDETLGVGAQSPFGSGEETDYLIRALDRGAVLEYLAGLTVHHPNKSQIPGAQGLARVRRYAAGMGRVLAKQAYPAAYRTWMVARPMAGALVAALSLRKDLSRLRWAVARGRVEGLLTRVEQGAKG
ncbi:MAG: glycosyltransferase family 2 protein [Zoogloeaceae bacterium]|nr:glycosyltransferase family 2 protein [Zoogloeaceae bacterium]